MTNLCSDIIQLLDSRTLVTAESCTGGGIGAALTAVPGSSAVFKGGIISYSNWVKENMLSVDAGVLSEKGAVSPEVAEAMAIGARERLGADIAVSVTGLAGPSGDAFGNPVGTVYVGYADETTVISEKHLFVGDRETIRKLAVKAALELILRQIA